MIRSKNIFSESDDMEHLYTIKNFPSFIGTSDQEYSKDICSDLIFDISKSSGIVQIRKLLPTDLVYKKFHSEALGNIWKDPQPEYGAVIQEYDEDDVLILEIKISSIVTDNTNHRFFMKDPGIYRASYFNFK